MTQPPNPFSIARDTQQMAPNASERDAAVFNKVAMVCMGVMAAVSVVQTLQPLMRGLRARDENRTREDRRSGR